MKVRIIQPAYSFAAEDIEHCYRGMLALIEECREPLDIIVLPEYCDIPSAQKGAEGYRRAIEHYNPLVLEAAAAMARRCHAITFVNCAHILPDGRLRNTTHALDREGRVVGRYYKAHPAPMEDKPAALGGSGIDSSYSHETTEPYTLELEGLRFGFMTCYDFYMYEAFAPLARKKVDIVIGCSHQRTDPHEALSLINRFLAYHTNAYVIRASVSLGEDSPIGGGSCVIAPSGEVLVDMKSRAGFETCEIDPSVKYYKAAGFGGRATPKPHYEYIEDGRRPWLYRNGGKAMVEFERFTPYPRLCAHRGLQIAAPENSLPALSSAVSLGATEIEFDLWETADGVIVSSHDATLERVSDGEGYIFEKTYDELRSLDFGVRFGESFRGLRIVTFEEILQKLASHVIMNIHIKTYSEKFTFREETLRKIVALIDRYDCRRHVYLMCTRDEVLEMAQRICPDIPRCVGAGRDPEHMVERALRYGCQKIQLFKGKLSEEALDDTIRRAHENGIICNLFWSDDPEEARAYLARGIDVILTNEYLKLKNALGLS